MRKGFTMLETMLALGVVSALTVVVVGSVNSRGRLTDARDGERDHHVRQLITAMSNHIYSTQSTQDFDAVNFPSGEASRKPLCRQGQVAANCPGSTCVNLDFLAGGQLTQLPYDKTEQCACHSGYEVYWGPGNRPFAKAAYMGKLPGDAPGSASCTACGNSVCGAGETCSNCPADCGACPPVCGDGTCSGTETCATCTADCGACPPLCGNGVIETGETCDDGNINGNDTCSPVCQPTTCGDGIVQSPNGQSVNEACDDANSSNTDACLNSCQNASCGDGYVQGGVETCSNCPADVGVCPPADAIVDGSVDESPQKQQRSPSVVFTTDTTGYVFYTDSGGECVFRKTTNGGNTWGNTVQVTAQTDCLGSVAWYDRWTPGDTTGTGIHLLYADDGSDDLWYRLLDTDDDSFTAPERNISGTSQGGSFGPNNRYSLTKSTSSGGLVYLFAGIADDTDRFFLRCNVATNCATSGGWPEINNPIAAAEDDLKFLPLSGGKILLIRWNMAVVTNAIRSSVWNGNVWSAWANVGSATGSLAYRSAWGATVRKSDNNIYLVWNNEVDAPDGSFKTSMYNGVSWAAKANVATNDRGYGVDIAIDETTGRVYTARLDYTGWILFNLVNVLSKYSTNDMTSWSADAQVNTLPPIDLQALSLNMMSPFRIFGAWYTSIPVLNDIIIGMTVADP